MSWSFGVPVGAQENFEQAATDAKAAYVAGLASNDYGLAQMASGQADEAIEAAHNVLQSGVLGEGNVSASLSGHAVPAGGPVGTSSIGISVSVTPVPAVEPEAPAPVEAAPDATSPA